MSQSLLPLARRIGHCRTKYITNSSLLLLSPLLSSLLFLRVLWWGRRHLSEGGGIKLLCSSSRSRLNAALSVQFLWRETVNNSDSRGSESAQDEPVQVLMAPDVLFSTTQNLHVCGVDGKIKSQPQLNRE